MEYSNNRFMFGKEIGFPNDSDAYFELKEFDSFLRLWVYRNRYSNSCVPEGFNKIFLLYISDHNIFAGTRKLTNEEAMIFLTKQLRGGTQFILSALYDCLNIYIANEYESNLKAEVESAGRLAEFEELFNTK